MSTVCCCSICLVILLILLVLVIASTISMIMSYGIMIWDKITGKKRPQPYLYPQPMPHKAYYCKNCGRQLGFIGDDRWYCYACGSYTVYGNVKKKMRSPAKAVPEAKQAPVKGEPEVKPGTSPAERPK